MRTHALIALLLVASSACATVESEPRDAAQQLGEITFPTTGEPLAQPAFLRGVLLLHSFEYADAAEAFREAQALDPDFVLAYWGEALTHSHPLWNKEDLPAARAALAKLAATPEERAAAAIDPRERALLASVEALFGDGDKAARHAAYAGALAELHERFPEDHEIAAFYALSILGTSLGGRDVPTYMRAAAVAEQVHEENPDHPGALHYLIHSYDDPAHAPLGLRFARRYDKVAPAAAHALHMPSHIYVALGMWDDSVAANVASSGAADARVDRKQLSKEERGYHSLWWLCYSLLQLGRAGEARALVEQMERDAAASGSERTRFHLAAMRNEFVLATQEWDGELARLAPDLTGLGPRVAAAHHLVNGLAARARGDLAAAEMELAALRSVALEEDGDRPAAAGLDDCCAVKSTYDGLADATTRQASQAMAQELEGALLLSGGRVEEGLALLRSAAATEDAMGFDFGPPVVVKPAHELLGEALLDQARAGEAIVEFQAALRRAPRRTLSLLGLARAAGAAGEERIALEARSELARSLHRADADFAGLAAVASAR